jgi:hypothetical protein
MGSMEVTAEGLVAAIEHEMDQSEIPGDLWICKFGKPFNANKPWLVDVGVEDGEVEGVFQGEGNTLTEALQDALGNLTSNNRRD